jgi:hypothetical protein
MDDLPDRLRRVVERYARASGQEALLSGEFVGELTAEALWAVWQQHGCPPETDLGRLSERAQKWVKSLLPVVRCVRPALRNERPLSRIDTLRVLADREQVMAFVAEEALAAEIGAQARRLVEWDGEIKRSYANWWRAGLEMLAEAVARADRGREEWPAPVDLGPAGNGERGLGEETLPRSHGWRWVAPVLVLLQSWQSAVLTAIAGLVLAIVLGGATPFQRWRLFGECVGGERIVPWSRGAGSRGVAQRLSMYERGMPICRATA